MTSNQQWSLESDFEVLVDARSERRPHSIHNQDVSKKGHPDLNWVFITFTNFFSHFSLTKAYVWKLSVILASCYSWVRFD